jgi:SAM-dependent methyltransferase
MTLSAPCYDRSDYWRYFELDYTGLRVLDIGSSAGSYDKREEFRGARAGLRRAAMYVALDIDTAARPHVAGDAHLLPFANDSFDVILANNVIEHLREPAAGVSEMRRVLAPRGQVLYTIPFLYPVHEAPHDYARFTRYGLTRLFREFSAVEIHARGGAFSTLAQLLFLLTRAADRVRIGGMLRVILYPGLWLAVQLDRFDNSDAFARVYYGRLRK